MSLDDRRHAGRSAADRHIQKSSLRWFTPMKKQFWKCSAGAVAVVTALVLPVSLGFTSLGIEVGHWYLGQRLTPLQSVRRLSGLPTKGPARPTKQLGSAMRPIMGSQSQRLMCVLSR